MESWHTPYLTVTAPLFVFLAYALWRFFGVEKDLKGGVDFALGEAKGRTVREVTELMRDEAERGTEPAYGIDPVSLGRAMGEDRERRAKPVIQEQWRVAMACSRLLGRMGKLKTLEFIGRLFCLGGLIGLVGYALSILFWLSKDSRLFTPVTFLTWGVPVVGVVCVRTICEIVVRRIQSVQGEIEEPWRV